MEITGRSFSFGFEAPLIEWFQTHIGGAGMKVISTFSMFGEELVLILLIGFIFWCWDKKWGKQIGLNVLMGLIWNAMIKNVFLRRRPYFDHEGINILRPVEKKADLYDISAQGFSFPSGHSTNAAAAYGSLARLIRKPWIRWIAALVCLLVGFSRVAVGAHYPSDVLIGWTLGLAVIFIVPWLCEKIKNQKLLYLTLLALSVPGMFYCKSTDYFTSMGLLLGFMAGSVFEEKFVRFENTRKPFFMILRVVGGIAVFMVLSTVLKLPFSASFLDSGTYAAMMVRMARYAVIAFVNFGVYPLVFRWI